MKHLFFFVIFFFMSILALYSQTIDNGTMSWDDFVILMADESDDEYGPDSETFEELIELHNNPMNLNSSTYEDLHKLPFLSEDDIKNILFYRDNHYPMFSVGELMFIYSLDRQKRMIMQLFCYAGETKETQIPLKNIVKFSHHELIVRNDIPFYTKEGYKDYPDSIISKNPNKRYQGNKYYHSLRYNISSLDHLFAGFQMEKDAGENYIDHFAGYIMLKNIGKLKTAIIGNYKISFGHGLVINTGSVFGKTMKLNSMDIIDKGISRQSSTTENGYLTGAATTFNLGRTRFSAFCSYNKADATYLSDSTGLSALKTDGLHRTLLEKSKKGNITKSDFGGNIHFDFNNLQLSATIAFTHLSVPLAPQYNTPSSTYRYYNPKGSDFLAYSIAYSYRVNHIYFSGETAINSSGGVATINQLQWTPNSLNTITLIQRQYGAKYHSLNAHAFGENSNVHNERGFYLGFNNSTINKLKLNAYIDVVYFPWLKYQVSNSSYLFETQLQATYSFSEHNNLSFRYRIKSKQKDNSEKTNLVYKTTHNLRLQYNTNPSEKIALRTTLSAVFNNFENKTNQGFSISQAFRYSPSNKLRIDIAGIYFNTDNYDTRIYNYESSLLYSFAMNSYYYNGLRTTILFNYNVTKKFIVSAKFASTNYFNKNNIGTGLELINNNHKEDLLLQIRCKL